jgi:hemoglobin
VAAGESDDVGEDSARGAGDLVAAPRPASVYEILGGMGFFEELVERFYRRVATDLLLRPLYPDDLTASKQHLTLFLAQYWGGPTTYSEERGHPRLRMRHAPFIIGEPERDAWLRHMNAAIDSLVDEWDVHPVVEARLLDYMASAADAMVNTR